MLRMLMELDVHDRLQPVLDERWGNDRHLGSNDAVGPQPPDAPCDRRKRQRHPFGKGGLGRKGIAPTSRSRPNRRWTKR